MGTLSQANRHLKLETPLGPDVLVIKALRGKERVDDLFEYALDLLSETTDIASTDIMGGNVTVSLENEEGQPRYFNGYVSRFAYVGLDNDLAQYQATIVPWFWFLTRTSDCRIFQEKTVPEIIKEIFAEHGFSDFEESLSANYRVWEYCVQYRESDFNFLSRLMEQEGIYYYFKHHQGKHMLIIADSYSAHELISGYEQIPYYPKTKAGLREREHISQWGFRHELQSGAYMHRGYDFKAPKKNLETNSIVQRQYEKSDFEVYDYPGGYREFSDGENYARVRLEEIQSQYQQYEGEGNARGLCAGGLFELTGYPREDQKREYLVLETEIDIRAEEFDGETLFRCTFTVLDSQEPYRALSTTRKPVVQGPQTAVVTGPSGEEIWTDEYGRVKVQFHWDRYGQSDQNSSCWLRVSYPSAGKNWGGIAIPRIGQEVIVSFLEGDPDQPIITGRVYNADNMPPYELPANATQSGMKSRSSLGGGPDNFNEIRFEDKTGSEEMYIHAEKDQNSVVENDQTLFVGHDKSMRVENDRSESIGQDRSLDVGRDKSETIGRNKIINVGSNHTETVGSAMNISIGSTLTETVGVNYAETVGGAMELTVGGALAITVGAAMAETVGGTKAETIGISKTETIGSNKTVSVGSDLSETVGKERKVKIGKDLTEEIKGKHREVVKEEYSLQAKKIQLTADDEISLKTGKAEIVMKKNGDITVKGKKIIIKGSGDVIMKGSKIKEN